MGFCRRCVSHREALEEWRETERVRGTLDETLGAQHRPKQPHLRHATARYDVGQRLSARHRREYENNLEADWDDGLKLKSKIAKWSFTSTISVQIAL